MSNSSKIKVTKHHVILRNFLKVTVALNRTEFSREIFMR